MTESHILRRIMLALSRAGATVFRNNQGVAWQGDEKWRGRDLLLRNARAIRYGVCNPGGSDIIGWLPVTITPDMVGQTVAVFLAPEIKTERGRPTKDQSRFLAAVQAAGGIAGVARSEDEAVAMLGRTVASAER